MGFFSDVKMPNQDKLNELTKLRAKEKGIDFGAALREISLENSLLAEEARREVLRGSGGANEAIPGTFQNRPHSWELYKKAQRRAAERLLTFEAARAQIESEEPELAEKARSEGGMDVKDIRMLPSGVPMIICHTEFGGTSDPAGLLADVAKNRARYKRIAYHEALSEICRDYPILAAAARKLGR